MSGFDEVHNKDSEKSRTFPVPDFITTGTFNSFQIKDNFNKLSNEDIILKAFRYHSDGNLNKAINSYKLFLDKGFKDPRLFLNYGAICQQLGKNKLAIKLY